MGRLKTLQSVEDAFLAFSPPGMTGHYKLERMYQLMDHLGNPQNKLKVVHIAGTSGKTSTAYFIRGLLEAGGMKTGLTVSPHITAINERLQIGGTPLDTSAYIDYTNDFLDIVTLLDIKPTYFELLIAMAYWVFYKEKVDYVVVETGLGGLLDGTNVVSRLDKICVITDIGLDHTEILGNTLPEIAAQKAGIIQQKNHVLIRQQDRGIMDVVARTAKAKQAMITIVEQGHVPATLPLFQHHNWALAVATVRYIQARDSLAIITPKSQEEVALQTPPGRWEVYYYLDKMIILDGAHNPQKIQALCASLYERHITSAAVLMNYIVASDLKIQQSLEAIQAVTAHLIVPEFNTRQDLKGRRSMPASKLVHIAQRVGIDNSEIELNVSRGLCRLLARPEKVLLITGSLYLVSVARGEVRRLVDMKNKSDD